MTRLNLDAGTTSHPPKTCLGPECGKATDDGHDFRSDYCARAFSAEIAHRLRALDVRHGLLAMRAFVVLDVQMMVKTKQEGVALAEILRKHLLVHDGVQAVEIGVVTDAESRAL